LKLETEERARAGLFWRSNTLLIPGVSNLEFFESLCDAQREARGEDAITFR